MEEEEDIVEYSNHFEGDIIWYAAPRRKKFDSWESVEIMLSCYEENLLGKEMLLFLGEFVALGNIFVGRKLIHGKV